MGGIVGAGAWMTGSGTCPEEALGLAVPPAGKKGPARPFCARQPVPSTVSPSRHCARVCGSARAEQAGAHVIPTAGGDPPGNESVNTAHCSPSAHHTSPRVLGSSSPRSDTG